MKHFFKLVFICLLLFLINSCVSFKKQLLKSATNDVLIYVAIADFTKNSKLYKKDSVFRISFYDPLYRGRLEQVSDIKYKLEDGLPYEGIIAISIFGVNGKPFILSADGQIGNKDSLPSRYLEQDGKLFYWHDRNYHITEQTLAIFRKYHAIHEISSILYLPSIQIDDGKKGVHYYFCRNKQSIFKKETTNIAIGYYEPGLRCDR